MPQLSLEDLVSVVNIIDLAASRGAFRGEDLLGVGQIREKIAVYVNEQLADKSAGSPAVD